MKMDICDINNCQEKLFIEKLSDSIVRILADSTIVNFLTLKSNARRELLY